MDEYLLSLVDLGDYEEFESTASVTWTSDTTHVKPPVVSDIGQKFLQFIGRPQQTAKATNTSAAPSP